MTRKMHKLDPFRNMPNTHRKQVDGTMEAYVTTMQKLNDFELQLWLTPGLDAVDVEPPPEPEPGTPKPIYETHTPVCFDVNFFIAPEDRLDIIITD